MKRSKYLQLQYLSKEELAQYDKAIADHNRAVLFYWIKMGVIVIALSLLGGYIFTLL